MPELRRIPFEQGIRIEMVQGEEAISGLKVFDRQMHLGHVLVRCAGVGDVFTKREHRLNGYSRQVLEEGIRLMQEEGYHFAALFGIPNYYPKFGFASALIASESAVATRDAEAARARYAVRPFRPEDARAVAGLYESLHGQRTGCIRRDPAAWSGFHWGPGWTERLGAFVVLDEGEIIGYASYNQDAWRFAVGETGYRDQNVFSTLLAETARLAQELRVEKITFHAPPDDPFIRYCRRYGSETKITHPRYSGGMARIINQRELLALAQPVLARRLASSGRPDWRGTLLFQTDLGEDALCFGEGGETTPLRMPQWMLAQLLLGYRAAPDVLFESDAEVAEEIVPILEILFPEGYPFIWFSDKF